MPSVDRSSYQRFYWTSTFTRGFDLNKQSKENSFKKISMISLVLRRSALGCRGLNKTPLHRMFSIQRAPMMLMEVEHCVYPNLFLFLRNFLTSLTIKNFYDRTFDSKKFADGARQALTVVSQIIGEGQFDDLGQFVRPEVDKLLVLDRAQWCQMNEHLLSRSSMKSKRITKVYLQCKGNRFRLINQK